MKIEPLSLTVRELCEGYADHAEKVSKTNEIPKDYDGVMGVPITYLYKHDPGQFEIVGCSYDYGRPAGWSKDIDISPTINGANIYKRIFIRRRK